MLNMGRRSTSAHILDELKALSIADLKRFGYLHPGTRTGTLSWSYYGNPTGNVSVAMQMWENAGYLRFAYTYNQTQDFQYNVHLIALPTNLGIGQRWYFICPRTGKRCTKLFVANGYFQHREGIPGAMYRSQTRSHYRRSLDKYWNANDRLHRRHLKWHYKGRPTKRYLRAVQANAEAEPLALAFLRRWG